MRLILLLFSVISYSCISTKEVNLTPNDVPILVQESFKELYPDNLSDVEWSKEGNYYEAEFENTGKEVEVLFMAKGTRIQTETEIDFEQLPLVIQNIMKDRYAAYSIDDIDELLSVQNGLNYEIELEKEEEQLKLVFNEKGKLLKKKEQPPEKEELTIPRRLYP